MSPSRFRRPVIVSAAALVLAGCGATDSGTAVRVGDATIPVSEVDGVARAICTSSEPQLEEVGQTVPMSLVRQAAVNVLTLNEVALQVADEYGVDPGPGYERERARLRQEAESLPEDQRDDFVSASITDALLQGVWLETGWAALVEEGETEPTEQEATERGAELFWEWPERYDLEVNPLYDMELSEGQLRPAGGKNAVGVAVSDTARLASSTEPDPSRAAGLPSHLRCG